MKTTRHYFVSDDLDDLELLETQLESQNITNPQIHVLSHDDMGVAQHTHLHAVQSLMKRDTIHSGEIGALVGAVGAILVLVLASTLGMTESPAGWIPFLFLAVIVFGFCTWEGGLIGIQSTNKRYKQFESALDEGKHIFIVELGENQEGVLSNLLQSHQDLEEWGTEKGPPSWIFVWRQWLFNLIDQYLYSHSHLRQK